jgi:hypothetical protein
VECKPRITTDQFLEIHAKTYERQGKKTHQPETLCRLIETAHSRNQGNIWGAFDKAGQLHAAVFAVWQENCAYYIAGGSSLEGRKSGAQLLILSEAISEVSKFSIAFDFEGSMMPGVERVFRSFGAIQTPYFTITKGSRPLLPRLINVIRNHSD